MKITKFTDLNVWKHGHLLAIETYKLTHQFPRSELYALTSQMRRSAISITSNISEGFSRSSSKEKIHFYYISKGSLTELQNQLLLARDLGYACPKDVDRLAKQTVVVGRLLTGFIKSAKLK